MSPIVTKPRATDSLDIADAPVCAKTRPMGLRDRTQTILAGLRQVFGIPDYDRYLAHMTAHHPDEPVLTRRDFFARSIDRKYSRSGPRCC